jgi:hypothetical protein
MTFALGWAAALAVPLSMVAQVDENPAARGPRYGKDQTVYFEFGLRIRSQALSTGLLGSVPIPNDWPEQTVTIVQENSSGNLRKISYKNLTREIRQMILKVNRLDAGEVASGSVIVRVDKRFIEPPSRPDELVFASRIPSPVRQYLRPSPWIESDDREIRKLAASLEIDEQASAWKQVEQIYNWVRDRIEYKFDTQIHSCLDALQSRTGDCEEMSSVFIALCRARGIPARAVWIPAHTYPEFFLVDADGNGYWIPCQIAGAYEFGAMSELRPILQKGDRFKLPGNPKPLRYVQPTLVAKDSPGGLEIEFIARQITEENELRELRSSLGDESTD